MPYKNREDRLNYQKKYHATEEYRLKRKEQKKNPRWIAWHAKYVKGEVATKYRAEYNKKQIERGREIRWARRKAMLDGMGGKCVRCGFNDYRALQVDHVNADGVKERNIQSNATFCPRVLDSFTRNEGRYQILCCNCNWIKRAENGEYRKKRESQ